MTIGLVLGLIELYSISFESRFFPAMKDVYAVATIFFGLILSIMAIWSYSIHITGGIVVIVVATDAFAYFGGNLLGGKIYKGTRPFPKISPKKTWEGCVAGLLFGLLSALLWTQLVLANPSSTTVWMLICIPPFAIAGDVLESFYKRRAGVKDSNEFVTEVPVLRQIEELLGGSGGHGGYLDRLDALSFVMGLYYLLDIVLGITI